MKIPCADPEAVVKRAYFLAYEACGQPMGMGVFQAREAATEDDVWKNVRSHGDYESSNNADAPGAAYGDYVFGRMMKLSLNWTGAGVECGDHPPRLDFQSWCQKYPTYQALVEAALKSIATN